jgi:phthalate 4,5-dioxygenase
LSIAREARCYAAGAKRQALEDGRYHWRLTTFAYPTFTAIPGPKLDGCFFVIPRDDETSWWFMIRPLLDASQVREPDLSNRDPYRLLQYGRAEFDATLAHQPNSWRLARNGDNDYLIDRDMQRRVNYTGLPTNRVQDAAVTETMGPIYDRTQEHPEWFRQAPLEVVSPDADMPTLWERHHADFLNEFAGTASVLS